jgi:hypothetical protein|tara:strand:+ start:782 stop:1585 length:804 start_codon:yes stop_codon:yes gene_type:complete
MTHQLSFNLFGKYGRLGNQMFQYAAVLGISKITGHTPVCNISASPLFSKCFDLGSVKDDISSPQLCYEESGFEYQKEVESLPSDKSIDLRGYYQSEKYFKHVENEILDDFDFSNEVRNAAAKKVPSDACVSVHVRRGDYLHISDFHCPQPVEYYFEALERFPDYRPVFFSDDIDWCKEQFSDVKNDPVFIDNDDSLNLSPMENSDLSGYVDMCAMSFCNAHVIANSSFSWWGAWLGRGKTIAPKKWFGPANESKKTDDLYCENWEII